MGNSYKVDGITYTVAMQDNHWTNGQVDMHGYPVYEEVKNVQNELQEKELREKHPDLAKAYEDYKILLKKYGFWDKITK